MLEKQPTRLADWRGGERSRSCVCFLRGFWWRRKMGRGMPTQSASPMSAGPFQESLAALVKCRFGEAALLLRRRPPGGTKHPSAPPLSEARAPDRATGRGGGLLF